MMPKRVIFFTMQPLGEKSPSRWFKPWAFWFPSWRPPTTLEKFTFSLTIPKFGHVTTQNRQVYERVSEAEWCEWLPRGAVSLGGSLEKFVGSEIAHLGKLTPEDVDSCCPKIRWYCWCAKMVCLETDGGSSINGGDPHCFMFIVVEKMCLWFDGLST